MTEQIVYQGHTPAHVWEELEIRSRQTRILLALQCPICSGEIQHTETTDLRCLSCNAPVEVLQHRHLTENVDTRLIYIHVNGHEKECLRLPIRCLSCEAPLTREETCPNTCETQTYFLLERDDGQLYVKRWLNHLNAPRETTQIPIRTPSSEKTQAPETDTTAHENQPTHQPTSQPHAIETEARRHTTTQQASQHKDVIGQIRAFFNDFGVSVAKTQELRNALKCSRVSLNNALKKLQKDGEIRKIAHGYYEIVRKQTIGLQNSPAKRAFSFKNNFFYFFSYSDKHCLHTHFTQKVRGILKN